ncbi:hypothetical protein P3X46_028687 [Hevea brasiliensis]|uniref:F-box domain-containing protein n=1 Tax=Hevea brasiliensis TaxID=3981 RepID=A0ABQ9KSX5_HEVBR|nr:F-box protein AUF2 [Hevea brasiliensis]KAJ9146418.1 hypothetical protein P3X46_028687 [Hevea brasiliensis]
MDGFDRLPDSLILLIFNSVSDVKTLIRCRSVSKRFYSLVPETESLLLRVDRVISPESDTESLLFSFLKSLLKSIQDLFKSDHKPTATLTLTHNSPAQILSQFHRIRDLQIQLPAGDLKLDKGVVIKWRAEFGNTLKSCVILGFRTAARDSEDGNADVDFDFAGGLKARVVWTISALIAASARHYLLKEVVKEHEEMERLELKDKETEGIVVMDKEGLRECRMEKAASDREWEASRTVVPSARMRMRHEPRVQLNDGSRVEGATLVVVWPCVGKEVGGVQSGEAWAADVEDAKLATGAFGGEGVYEELAALLVKSKAYLLEMNSF